jgi:PAS domain S-box-containing protein
MARDSTDYPSLSVPTRDSGELEKILLQLAEEIDELQRQKEKLGQELELQKALLWSILNNIPEGIILLDDQGRIVIMNRRAEVMLQYTIQEVLGKPVNTALASKKNPRLVVQKVIKRPWVREAMVMRKDGSEIPLRVKLWSVLDEDGKETTKVVCLEDLTRSHELTQHSMRNERLSSLGELSMGIAHEIRNPLAGMRITAQALEEEVGSNPLAREYVSRIISEIDRLNELLKSFFSFAKPQKPALVPCRLEELVREVIFILEGELRERGVEVEMHFPAEVPQLMLDTGQMKQVLFNLVINAMQAMAHGGTLRIGISSNTEARPPEVILSVADTGKGINPEHRSKIFDPFFTTKAKGLGLGLSISHRIVQAHGGRMSFQSEVGKGTTFHVHLPVKKDEGEPPPREGKENRGEHLASNGL